MSEGSTPGMASTSGKRTLPSNRLVEEKIRVTAGQRDSVLEYQGQHPGKKMADAWRDVINAGIAALRARAAAPLTIAGSIRAA